MLWSDNKVVWGGRGTKKKKKEKRKNKQGKTQIHWNFYSSELAKAQGGKVLFCPGGRASWEWGWERGCWKQSVEGMGGSEAGWGGGGVGLFQARGKEVKAWEWRVKKSQQC